MTSKLQCIQKSPYFSRILLIICLHVYSSLLQSLPKPLTSKSQISALEFLQLVHQRKTYLTLASNNLNTTTSTHPDPEHLKNMRSSLDRMDVIAQKVRKLLLRSNLRLVVSIALQLQGNGLELNDLFYEGVKGLDKAIDKFDTKKNCAFSTYAYPWIKDQMRAALAKSLPISLPQHVYKLLVKVKNTQNRLLLHSGHFPTDEELRTELGISVDKFEIVKRAIALESRSSDSTPALRDKPEKSQQQLFHESTWEQVVAPCDQGFALDHVESSLQSEPVQTAQTCDIRIALFSVLSTIPPDEAGALCLKLGLQELYELSPAHYSSIMEDRTYAQMGERTVVNSPIHPNSVDSTDHPENTDSTGSSSSRLTPVESGENVFVLSNVTWWQAFPKVEEAVRRVALQTESSKHQLYQKAVRRLRRRMAGRLDDNSGANELFHEVLNHWRVSSISRY